MTYVYVDYAKMFVGRRYFNSFHRSRDSLTRPVRTQGLDDLLFAAVCDGRMPSIGLASRRNLWACKMEVKDGSRSITSHDSGTGRIIGDPESLELVIDI